MRLRIRPIIRITGLQVYRALQWTAASSTC